MSTKQMWHSQIIQQLCDTRQVTPDSGLFEIEIINRRSKSRTIELIRYVLKNPYYILLEKFSETVVGFIIIAAIISVILSDWKDAVAIAVIVVLNAALGFIKEYRAERALTSLKQMENAPDVRSERASLFKQGAFSIKLLLASVTFTFII